MEAQPIIKIKNLEKTYGQGRNMLRVLKGISLEIGKGENIAVVGPSGAGKSTLLNIIGCLDGFQNGNLEVMSRDISHLSVEDLSSFRNHHIGFIFQLHNLLAEFTAVENVMIPLLIRRTKKSEARERAMVLLDKFGLTDRAHHKPGKLSGGECQRIAVARAIVGEPDIILADEPTGSLDTENSMMLTNTLFKLGSESNTTVVMVTHDTRIAAMTERTITLVDGEIKDELNDKTEDETKQEGEDI